MTGAWGINPTNSVVNPQSLVTEVYYFGLNFSTTKLVYSREETSVYVSLLIISSQH